MSKRKKILLALLISLLLIPVLLLAAGTIGFEIWASDKHIDANLLPSPSSAPTFYDSSGKVLESITDDFVYEGEAPTELKNAFIAVEDKRFYSHKGYDAVRICGAIVKNLKSGSVKEGASTITQQLIKNTHLSHERTLKRKLKEIALARELEKNYSKDSILDMYMSVIYFGSGAYGVKSAAKTFFGKQIGDLSLAECATLAGIVKNPAGYSPVKKPTECVNRRDLVLSLMLEQGLVSKEEYEAAKREKLTLATADDAERGADCALYIALAKQELTQALGITAAELMRSNMKVYLNIDMQLQRALLSEQKDGGNFESDEIGSQAIVLDNDGARVLAYSSTYPYQVTRQTGSVIKPFAVYAPALSDGMISLATPIVDEEIDFAGFSPENFGGKYYGETNVREGIKKSMNSVSVKVLDYIGVNRSVQSLSAFGIDVAESDKNYTLALGATAATPASIAAAYCALANDGRYLEPSFVNFVCINGEKRYLDKTPPIDAVSPSAAHLMTIALADTVKDGTAKTLSALPFEVAAKTGTAQRSDSLNSDSWCASYNADKTVLVWHGSDVGMTERGGGHAARHASKIWRYLDGAYSLERTFGTFQDTVPIAVDTYSTSKKHSVTIANENTPSEYRKTEYFAAEYLPVDADGLFDDVSPCPLEIDVFEGHVELSFTARSIFEYKLYRTDVFGRALIYSSAGDEECVRIEDTPTGFGKRIEYELVCSLKNNSDLSASTYKSVFFEPGFMLYSCA